MAFTTIPAKTVGTVGTNTRNPATVRVTRWLRVGTKWEQSGNKVRTVLHSERNHSCKPYFFPPLPLYAQSLALLPCRALRPGPVRLSTLAHIRGIERVMAFPWNHLRGRAGVHACAQCFLCRRRGKFTYCKSLTKTATSSAVREPQGKRPANVRGGVLLAGCMASSYYCG